VFVMAIVPIYIITIHNDNYNDYIVTMINGAGAGARRFGGLEAGDLRS
jgi:hypothetical protein